MELTTSVKVKTRKNQKEKLSSLSPQFSQIFISPLFIFYSFPNFNASSIFPLIFIHPVIRKL
ncbi:hypothetical protein CHY_2466 [Carboxydothermus hydrogenoformans Z-2901]|uniref:Uncharacterized protein n=1 Tax=Carboxydothermus hydrogenoformans (strain ATCC BAA-161 / DSM 6008 / Z-2901) TaxID=246194 RepID=Q3A9C4_CARHZ|nr:hypothetical protein CHY_2466 [Carboxydothermus hydrogenoformans Z-2901]